jgi:hypothetical protein
MEPDLAGSRCKAARRPPEKEKAMRTSLFKMIGVLALVLGALSMLPETAARSQKAPEDTHGGLTFSGPTHSGQSGPVVLFNCPRNKKC